ncbi:putative quinol monooxygenase [Uliginosibacterium paludis]|uniref:Quinol monooxygenase n=1 Tax=Uliginosibacterium paludis TaxID=1615952 RepID=A0ABV2CTX2_9RHOO
MSGTQIHVITLAEALPEHFPEVLETLSALANLCRQEEGCIRFDVYVDSTQPYQLNTIETWRNREDHQRHLDSAHVARGVLSLIGKMKGLPHIRILRPISELSE